MIRMGRMVSLTVASAILLATPAFAGPGLASGDVAAVDAIAQNVIAKLKSGNSSAAVNAFFGSSSLVAGKQAEMQLVSGQIDSTLAVYGPISACELVEEQTRGTLVSNRLYLCSHAKYATRWTMLFVKSTNGWVGGFLNFDDKVQKSLGE